MAENPKDLLQSNKRRCRNKWYKPALARAGHTWVPLQDRGHGKPTDRFAMTFFFALGVSPAAADAPRNVAGDAAEPAGLRKMKKG